jgi:hypothetical protein
MNSLGYVPEQPDIKKAAHDNRNLKIIRAAE